MDKMKRQVFDNRVALDRQLAGRVAAILSQAIDERGEGSLVVSGGSTPLNFFSLLSEKELPWQKVTISLADERWVSPDQADSNERLVKEHLLINAAENAVFIPLKTDHADALDAEADLGRRLSALGQFDLVILGMGIDGHTASLFPDAVNLETGLDLNSGKPCLAVTPISAPHQRMSMTLPRLLNSRQLFIHITGEEKKQVLDQAWRENKPLQHPIAALINQDLTPVTLYYAP